MKEWISAKEKLPLVGQRVILRQQIDSENAVREIGVRLEYNEFFHQLWFVRCDFVCMVDQMEKNGITHWRFNPHYRRLNASIAGEPLKNYYESNKEQKRAYQREYYRNRKATRAAAK